MRLPFCYVNLHVLRLRKMDCSYKFKVAVKVEL